MATSSSTDASYYSAASHLDPNGQKDPSETVTVSRSDEKYSNSQKVTSSATTLRSSSEVISHSEKSQNGEKLSIDISANSSPKFSVTNNSFSEPHESVIPRKTETPVATEGESRMSLVKSTTEQRPSSEQINSGNKVEHVVSDNRKKGDETDGKMAVTVDEEITNEADESVGFLDNTVD